MRTYLESFLVEYEYPSDSISELMLAYDKLILACADDFDAMINEYEACYDIDYHSAIQKMSELARIADIHEYTAHLLLFLCYTRGLRSYYAERGISWDIYKNTVLDLRYKLDECICVKGVVGSFVAKWFSGFFRLERFALGRLQFEIIPFGGEYSKNGLTLSPDTPVINVHIPRTGGRLERALTLESYRLAADFFRPRLGDNIAFVCSSWLLFPKHREILNPGSNLFAFMNDFDIISSEDREFVNAWRVFGKSAKTLPVEEWPEKTALQKAYKKRLLSGGSAGSGFGVKTILTNDNLV